MAPNRKAAKAAVVDKQNDDPDLEKVFSDATHLQLELNRENNRHREKMNSQNLGIIGNLVGDGRSIPMAAALAVMAFSLLVAAALYCVAYVQPSSGEIWMAHAERALAVAAAALSYVFGKGSR